MWRIVQDRQAIRLRETTPTIPDTEAAEAFAAMGVPLPADGVMSQSGAIARP